ncbi:MULTISPECIES: cob(I)yrinic acid a,c-diamide adenosyltransferase [Metallosphaera]|uniref:cob(I)yrinic acid a,c-diamide adenosyltransferase n=1 Tax=Metallosphaera TaxID=41980 RepID=UPI001F07024A|nr:cob(I)yrinic acid a,c-diamide adenosyltransferase [Metallosphaera sedula]MCH1770027.1 cob(I)yrinic acid a,c-diamide adenosyltransferase [Metallosphaera sedula]MCP6728139.1 cob(I)yrinic acid a,c-diamide adenosyltransferase [Metallosphaera sedula]
MSGKWYTGTGDSGLTRIPSIGQVWKDDKLVEALGNLDELNSVLGVVVSLYPDLRDPIQDIQKDIFEISSEIAGFDMGFEKDKIEKIEKLIDIYGNQLDPLKNFVLPGGHLASSFLHLARAVCRRAERSVVSLYRENRTRESHVIYLNRLSSLLFVLGLWVNKKTGNQDVIWKGKSK